MAFLIRDAALIRVIDDIVEDNVLLTRTHALYFLVCREYPEKKRIRIALDYMNDRANTQEAHSIHLLPNVRKKIMRMIINGCDFETIYSFYLRSLKVKNSCNPKGWAVFEKMGRKGLKLVYDFVQKRKAGSFSDFNKIILDGKMAKKKGLEFFSEDLEAAVKIGEEDDIRKDKKSG